MSNGSEKVNKNWNVVIWFLTLFMLLVSVLILILTVETYYPELLKSLWEFIKYKRLIVIIALLASVSLLSFLHQIYIDSRKVAKTWKQIVTWFLTSFTLLVSVLIVTLIVEARYPKLSYLNEIIKDKPIFTIIPLFASVSLLLSLLQIYMNKDSEKADKIWKIVACPVHWAFHLAVRFLLLLAILVTFLIPLLILFLILIKIHGISWIWIESLSEWIKSLSDNKVVQWVISWEWIKSLSDKVVQWVISWEWIKSLSDDIDVAFQIATLFTSLGLFLFFIKREELYKPVLNVIDKIFQVFRGIRLPKMDIKKSLTETWMYDIEFIWPSIKKTFTEPLKLIPAALILYIILIFGLHSAKDLKKWQDNVTENLDSIRTDTADFILLRSSGLSPAYLSKKENQISFSLVYPPQGDLISKKGICPEDSSLNLEWLKFFKKAFSGHSKDGRMKLKIQGFASDAPVRVNDDTTKSNILNCEIANQRAEALIYFLMLPDSIPYVSTECKAVLENSSMWGRKENELCTRSAKPDTNAWKDRGFNVPDTTRSDTIVWKGPKFTVIYKPWLSHTEMVNTKPVQDSLRLDLEFLNRSVQIIIEEDSDRTETMPAPTAEDNTGQ